MGGDDTHPELVSLRDWLSREPLLRGGVHTRAQAISPGEMGALDEVLVVALGGGGAVTVLVRSVSVWLQQRRSTLIVKITASNGTQVEITSEGPAADQVATMLGAPRP
ncbi:hypothetical protein [Nocardia sp. NPDC052316]|uniref:effector-associated constant component EACC1 n=1 Tax=Nocardia sp. NPDC052316 TaxID=3364329 RepID=UPI0037C8E37E